MNEEQVREEMARLLMVADTVAVDVPAACHYDLADQILSLKGIRIKCSNQDLPLVLNDAKDFNNAYRDIGEGYVQKYMLTHKDGDVWVKCKVKEE